MKKNILICLSLAFMASVYATNRMIEGNVAPSPESVEGGIMEYTGAIGPYKVEFSYMNLHMGEGAQFMYRYTSITVNKGEWIELHFVKQNGNYQVWKEYINGKNTGIFTIQWNAKEIKGSFVNSKGKKYKVYAKASGGNWADAGDSPF